MGQLSVERMRKFEDNSHLFFDWMTVLRDANIKDVQDLQGQYLLKCPFHEDKRPSFRIRLHEHNYHCFSCNDFGSIAKLMYKLSGTTMPKSQYYENILKRMPAMQRELGFSSLYIDAYTLDEGFQGRRRFSAKEHIGSEMPLTVFGRKVRSAGDSWENLVYSLTLLQEGERPDVILSKITKSSSPKQADGFKPMSLVDLIGGEE